MRTALFIVAALAMLVTSLVLAPSSRATELRVVVDIGHSLKRPGATSARGRSEYHFNKELGLLLCQRLRENGFPETLCLDDESRDTPPARRAKNAKALRGQLLISVHHDAVQPRYLEEWSVDGKKRAFCDRFQGYSLFYSEKNPAAGKSLRLATAIGQELRAAGLAPTLHHAEPIPGENRELVDVFHGVYRFDDLLVLKRAAMPAVLLEAGVILDRAEELACQTPERRETVAMAVVRAVQRFLTRKE